MEKMTDIVTLGIDQSMNGTAICLLIAGRRELMETVALDKYEGFARIEIVTQRVRDLITTHQPHIVVMEDYARCIRNSSSLIQLVELGGCIKLMAHREGYRPGRDQMVVGNKIFMVQNQSTMKKFMLGDGSTQKDSRYLLTVFERLKITFDNDNEADAYMHAYMASIVVGVLRGQVPISNLLAYQQEALISSGVKKKKGLSLAKAMKLPDEEKLKLVGCYGG